METLHTMLRAIRETKARTNHLDVFREFLRGLGRAGRCPPPRTPSVVKRRRNGARRKAR